jgi:hypothetical protein
MKNLLLLFILLTVISLEGFSYELSAPIGGNPTEQTWTNFNPGVRNISISMDVYNLDATDPYGAPQASAEIKYWYLDSDGYFRMWSTNKNDHNPFYGPGAVPTVNNPGVGTPYSYISTLYIKVWRASTCQTGRSQAWVRADLSW